MNSETGNFQAEKFLNFERGKKIQANVEISFCDSLHAWNFQRRRGERIFQLVVKNQQKPAFCFELLTVKITLKMAKCELKRTKITREERKDYQIAPMKPLYGFRQAWFNIPPSPACCHDNFKFPTKALKKFRKFVISSQKDDKNLKMTF